MEKIASLGPCIPKYKKEGGTEVKTLGYMHDEDDVVFEGSQETVSHGAHGFTGAVEKRYGAFESTVVMAMYMDLESYADLADGMVTKNVDGTFTVTGAIGKKITPVQLHLSPKGAIDASEDLLFYRAFPVINENIVWSTEGKAKLNITFELSENLTTGAIYDIGVALT